MIDINQLVALNMERQRYLETNGIYFLGEITDAEAEKLGQSLMAMSVEREDRPDKPITIFINSGGGSVGAGLAMMQLIYRMRALISAWSHRLYFVARLTGRQDLYVRWANAAVAIYHGLAYSRGKIGRLVERLGLHG